MGKEVRLRLCRRPASWASCGALRTFGRLKVGHEAHHSRPKRQKLPMVGREPRLSSKENTGSGRSEDKDAACLTGVSTTTTVSQPTDGWTQKIGGETLSTSAKGRDATCGTNGPYRRRI